MISKTLEIIILDQLAPTFENVGFPSLTQTAYRKQVSSNDSVFTGQESISKFTSEGDLVYSCFYDLSSAFDTVEFCILLEHLFYAGVKGKCWRLIKVKCLGIWWTSDSSCCKSIDERMTKANGTFFTHGDLGAFHGLLNALSSTSLVETCIIRHVTGSDLT